MHLSPPSVPITNDVIDMSTLNAHELGEWRCLSFSEHDLAQIEHSGIMLTPDEKRKNTLFEIEMNPLIVSPSDCLDDTFRDLIVSESITLIEVPRKECTVEPIFSQFGITLKGVASGKRKRLPDYSITGEEADRGFTWTAAQQADLVATLSWPIVRRMLDGIVSQC